jgi:hypothetical protein
LLQTLKARLTKSQFRDYLTVTLSRVIERATVKDGGRRVLDGRRLVEAWKALPLEAREAFSPVTRRAIESMGILSSTLRMAGRIARTELAKDAMAGAVTTAAFGLGGLGVGVPLVIARQLISPGPLVRYLTRSELPSALVRTAGRETATTAIRAGLLTQDEDTE